MGSVKSQDEAIKGDFLYGEASSLVTCMNPQR